MSTKEFKLPERWCVKATPETVETLANYWDKNCRTNVYINIIKRAKNYHHIYWHSHNLYSGNPLFSSIPGSNHVSSCIQEGYTEITFEQFKEYFLKEPKIYTIQDLSDGKVACVNDGTLEELQEVIKTAFPNDNILILEKNCNYYKRSVYSRHKWLAFSSDEFPDSEPTQSVKEFYKQLKNKKMNKTFPLTLMPSDATVIISLACETWKNELATNWAKQIVLNENIHVSQEYYMKMRKACTKEQHKFFDDIFGKDESFPPRGTICRVWNNESEHNFLRVSDGKGKFYADGFLDPSTSITWNCYEVLTSLNLFKS
jgi:hypothetical protein